MGDDPQSPDGKSGNETEEEEEEEPIRKQPTTEHIREKAEAEPGGTVYDEIGRFLDDAKATVTQDRSETHGHVRDNLESTAMMWNAYLWAKTGRDPGLDAVDVALLMDLGKTSRAAAGSRDRDHFEDKNGYSAIAGGLEHGPGNGGGGE